MKGTLPILYVIYNRDSRRLWRVATAKTEARKLGWLPIDPFLLWDKDTGDEGLQAVRATLVDVADALLVVGDDVTRDMEKQLESSFVRHNMPVYGVPPSDVVPNRKKLAAPPFFADYSQAAVRVENVSGWACKTCRAFFGNRDYAERLARLHCVKETPCDKCGAPTTKFWTLCGVCRAVKDEEGHAKREKAPAPSDMMLYSDRDNEWFRDEDDAWSKAADRAEQDLGRDPTHAEVLVELRGFRLLLSEPVHASPVDLCDLTNDKLPDEDGDSVLDRLDSEVGSQLAALNEAIGKSSPLSYEETKVAVDVDATWPAPTHHVCDPNTAIVESNDVLTADVDVWRADDHERWADARHDNRSCDKKPLKTYASVEVQVSGDHVGLFKVKDLADGLLGLKVGEFGEVETDLPSDYEVAEGRNEPAVLCVKVLRVRRPLMPLTTKQAAAAYEAAVPVPLSGARIDEIVRFATGGQDVLNAIGKDEGQEYGD